MAGMGAMVGVPAFVTVIFAAPFHSPELFSIGVFLLGFGGGLFGHGTLTATMNLAPEKQVGLALGAWGAVQATAAGVAMAMGGIIRDIVAALARQNVFGPALTGPATGYTFVYSIEVVLLFATLVAMGPLVRRPGDKAQYQSSPEIGLAEFPG
jgi:BCD family chlorophyll transporter-like MFS transporter